MPFSQQRSTTQQQPIGFTPTSRTSTSGVGAIVNSSMNGGNPQKTFGSPIPAPKPVPTPPTSGMVLDPANIENLDITRAKAIIAAEEKRRADAIKNTETLGKIGNVKKPFEAMTFDEVVTQTGGDVKLAKEVLEVNQKLKNSQKGAEILAELKKTGKSITELDFNEMFDLTNGDANLAQTLYAQGLGKKGDEASSYKRFGKNGIERLTELAKSIHSGGNSIYSLTVIPAYNYAMKNTGQNPKAISFDSAVNYIAPIMVKASGQDKVSDDDVKYIKPILMDLAHPVQAVRDEALITLNQTMELQKGVRSMSEQQSTSQNSGPELPPAMKVNQQKQELDKIDEEIRLVDEQINALRNQK